MARKVHPKKVLAYASLSCLVAGTVILVSNISLVVKAQTALVSIPVLNKELKNGDLINAEDVKTVNVHPNAIVTDKLITNADDVVGKYLSRDTSSNEYLYSSHITVDKYERIADKVINTALAIPVSQLTSVNSEIRENDFVLISIVVGGNEDEEVFSGDVATEELPKVQIIEPPALSAVRILTVVDNTGQDIDIQKDLLKNENGRFDPSATLPQGSMVIVDVDARQRALILQGMNAGKLQFSILPESQQQIYRDQMFGTNSEVNPDLDIIGDTTGMTPEEIERRKQELAAELAAKEKEADEQLQKAVDKNKASTSETTSPTPTETQTQPTK